MIYLGEILIYFLDYDERCKEEIKKYIKKNKTLEYALEKAINKILENPEHFKTLNYPLQGARRVHVLGSFVLIYVINKNDNAIKLVRFEHHDNAYK